MPKPPVASRSLRAACCALCLVVGAGSAWAGPVAAPIKAVAALDLKLPTTLPVDSSDTIECIIISPDKLAGLGLKGLKAGDKLKAKALEAGRFVLYPPQGEAVTLLQDVNGTFHRDDAPVATPAIATPAVKPPVVKPPIQP